ncbi:3'-5' exoribonuclease [Streptomonospora litoralis]|uniref:3'-5' exoribonuclease.1 n=1 Tax=Streptomonospora litoralis TaxID=2498135 RepID=A0A4P6Q7Z8_9ACTN|nr:3'-5' exoribonuclease [Streptomonospora litoralis]QBI56835.1 3'-5' exoribonuclease.1 [Streptomonospora litoralis]
MTCYAYDFEFHEDGKVIDPISLAIVCEDGREYYAVVADAGWDRIREHDWLMRNVVPHLPITGRKQVDAYLKTGQRQWPKPLVNSVGPDHTDARVKPRWVVANEVREFLLAAGEPELWADFGAYNHVALAQLWGPMIRLPQGLPMFTRDLQQELAHRPDAAVPDQEAGAHDALADARHLMVCLRRLGIAEPAPAEAS